MKFFLLLIFSGFISSNLFAQENAALSFTGNNIVAINSFGNGSIPENFSVDFWIKPSLEITNHRAHIIRKGLRANTEFGVGYDYSKQTLYYFHYDGGSINYGFPEFDAPDNSLAKGEWNHVIVSINSSRMVSIYVNGTLVHEVTVSNYQIDNSKDRIMNLGSTMPAHGGFNYTGLLDEVRFWSEAIEDERVEIISNTRTEFLNSPEFESLIAAYTFNEHDFALSHTYAVKETHRLSMENPPAFELEDVPFVFNTNNSHSLTFEQGDYAYNPQSVEDEFLGDLTFTFWMKPGNFNVRSTGNEPISGQLIRKGLVNNAEFGIIYYKSTRQISYFHYDGASKPYGFFEVKSAEGSIDDQDWNFIGVRRTTDSIFVHINDQLSIAEERTAIEISSTSYRQVQFGNLNPVNSYQFFGLMDEFRLWNRALHKDSLAYYAQQSIDDLPYQENLYYAYSFNNHGISTRALSETSISSSNNNLISTNALKFSESFPDLPLNMESYHIGKINAAFNLLPNYPNPFNPTTTITFELNRSGNVRLDIVDALGRTVASLINNQSLPTGSYSKVFDATRLSSGVYFSVLEVNGIKQVRALTLIK